jgi:hypothetical protein
MPYISHSSDSDRCFTLLKKWLEDCRNNHECPQNSAASLPTRVIDVGEQGMPLRLVETGTLKSEYLTLSYVWGNSNKGITLKSNLDERLNSLAFESLCKTHQDAITITRKLGFQYLWIDALCIVQDDQEDWEKEAAQMFNIYRNSVLTLAATSSSSAECGIFSMRPVDLVAKTAIICGLKWKDDGGYDIEMLVSQIGVDPDDPSAMIDTEGLVKDADQFNGPFVLVRKPILSHGLYSGQFHKYWTAEDFPLEDRAWCFQERILSTRIVHFGKDELVWECNSEILCECGGMTRENDPTTRHKFQNITSTDDPRAASDKWMGVVSRCTSRKITRESDRLPTLSGLAKCLQERGFTKYLAGLWKEHLPAQLLWKCGRGGRRASAYRAPTWSFASVENVPIFNGLEHMFRSRRHFLATVESAVCRPAGVDITGNVAEGSIVLTGPTQFSSLEYRFVRYRGEMTKRVRYVVYAQGTLRQFSNDFEIFECNAEITYDESSAVPATSDPSRLNQKGEEEELALMRYGPHGTLLPVSGGPVLLLAICNEEQTQMKTHGKGIKTLYCLVLKAQSHKATAMEVLYERIGVLELDQDGEPDLWLKEAQEMTVTIV